MNYGTRDYRTAHRDAENQIEDLSWELEGVTQELEGVTQELKDIKQERDEYRLVLVTLRQMAKAGASAETLLAMVSFLNQVKTGGDDEAE